MARTIKQVQEDFGKTSGYKEQIIWDLFSEDQEDILKEKIQSLIPNTEKSAGPIQRLRDTLFKQIWAQRKYTNRNLLSSIIYVLVSKETNLKRVLDCLEFSCHPVFRIRKCVADGDSSNCCMIFIDETGRVYQNWSAYLSNNVLPKGTMVAPRRGVYTFRDDEVILDAYPTPASGLISNAVEVADMSASFSGFFALGVSVASVCAIPIAAPLLALAGSAGVASAAYSAVRSGSNLIDRRSHEQTISFANSSARGSWLGVLGGAIGLGASRATRALTTAATTGRVVSRTSVIVYNSIQISSIVLSGGGVAHGVCDIYLKYQDDEKINVVDFMQLGASLVIFTHSVKNVRLASTIVREAQNNTIRSYRSGLSNRQRKMFDKMTKETLRIRGSNRGPADVIRGANEISSKQYLNDLYKINQQLNRNRIRPSFGGADGNILLNNEVAVDTSILRNSVQHNVGPNVLSQVTQPIPESHNQAGQNSISFGKGGNLLWKSITSEETIATGGIQSSNEFANKIDAIRALKEKRITFQCGDVMRFCELASSLFERVRNFDKFEDVIREICYRVTKKVFQLVLKFVIGFIESGVTEIENSYDVKISTEAIFDALLPIIRQHEEDIIEYLVDKEMELINKLKKYFRSKTRFETKIVNKYDFEQITDDMARVYPKDIFDIVIKIAKEFITNDLPDIQSTLGIHISTEDVLQKLLKCCANYEEISYEILNQRSLQIRSTLKTNYLKLSLRNEYKSQTKCEICGGYFVVCDL